MQQKINRNTTTGAKPEGAATEKQTRVEGSKFSLDKFRVNQDYVGNAAVTQVITTVSARKPNKQDFFRVHPDPENRLDSLLLNLKEENEIYLVDPELYGELINEIAPYRLYRYVNRQGVESLWPARLPGVDGKSMAWWDSAHEAAALAMQYWTRMTADMSLGAYRLFKANGDLGGPTWSSNSFEELLEVAFKDRLIDSIEHPVISKLRGEI